MAMGHYISINLHFGANQSFVDLLRPLFSTDMFTPISVGAAQDGNYFLMGYDLSDFGAGFTVAKSIEFESATIAARIGDAEYSYLEELAQAIQDHQQSRFNLSPFERKATNNYFTVLDQKIPAEKLNELENWRRRFPKSYARLYGSISLHIENHPVPLLAYRSYAMRADTHTLILEPFLNLDLYQLSDQSKHIQLSSTSNIWLSEGSDGDVPIVSLKADKNLECFVNLTKLVYQAHKSNFLSGSIDLEGVFQKDRIRIYKAFHNPDLPLLEPV